MVPHWTQGYNLISADIINYEFSVSCSWMTEEQLS